MLNDWVTFLEGLQRGQAGLGILGTIDAAQGLGDRLAVLPGSKAHRVADQMYDAGLDHRLREHCVDRIWEALQSIDDGDQDIGHAPVLEFVHHPQPELGTLGLLDPDAEDFLGPVGQDAERDVDRLVAHEAFVPDLHPDRVEEHQRVAGIEWPPLPFRDRLQHGVGHRRDQVRRHRDKAGACRIEGLDQLCKIEQRAGEPVDLVDDHDVDLARFDIGQQALEGRALQRSAREATVIVLAGQQRPAFRCLAQYIGGAGLALGIERVEVLLKTFLARLPGVDGAADLCHAAAFRS